MYAQNPGQISNPPLGAFLFTKEAPPPKQMSPGRIVELNPERCAENVHHNAFYGEDEELDDSPEEDALETFHQGGPDEMEIFYNYISNSNDTMGTAESLGTIDASNASVMSMLSAFNGYLFDTPSCTPDCQDPSLCYTYSCDSEHNDHSFGSRFSYGKNASGRIPQTVYVGASDLSTSLHLDAFWGESPEQPPSFVGRKRERE
jgi:hypothetical protein